jgi:stage V sporulation protein S
MPTTNSTGKKHTTGDIIKVASVSDPGSVAGAIAGFVRQSGTCEAQAIGAGAVNQLVKAIAIARNYMQSDKVDLVCTPIFTDVEVNGDERTAMRFIIGPR